MASKSQRRRKRRRAASTRRDSERPRPEKARAAKHQPRPPRKRADEDERPPAPWGSFPLVELATLIALLMLLGGFFFVEGERGALMIGAGLVIGSLAGTELAIREHLAGYRSHTLLLAGIPTVVVMGVLFVTAPESFGPLPRLLAAAATFGLSALGLTALFRRRSGGYAFRFRGFK